MTTVAEWPELVHTFAGGLLLMGVAALLDRYRHRRENRALQAELAQMLGHDDKPMRSLLHSMALTLRDARVQFDYIQDHVTDEWTLQTWGRRWLELLRDRDARTAWMARTLIAAEGDPRDLAQFVRGTVQLHKNLHRFLLGEAESSAVPWTTCVAQLTAAAAQRDEPTAGLRGVIHQLDDERANHDLLTTELQTTRTTLERVQERLTALAPLLSACGIADDDDGRQIIDATDDIGMLLLVARRETGIDTRQGNAALAAALETLLLTLRSDAGRCADSLAATQRALAEAQAFASGCARSRDEATLAARHYENAASLLASRLELTRSAEHAMQHLLHGDLWTLRLLLVAAKEAWSPATATIGAELAAFLGTPAVVSYCSAAVIALEQLALLDAQGDRPDAIEQVEDLCRLFDAASRISEFRSNYRLQELDGIARWAGLFASATRTVLARRGVELRRPRLLQPLATDFDNFDANHRDEQMLPFPAIGGRIRSELASGNDGFVVDVTQSEVIIGGRIRRIGVLSRVTPHRWRT